MGWDTNIKLAVLLGSATAAAVTLAAVFLFMREREKKRKTRQGSYVEVGKVSQIFLYPLKSGRGWDLQQAESTRIGLRHDRVRDRQWMIVDERNDFITARQERTLVLVTSRLDPDGHLSLDAPGMPTLKVPVGLTEGMVVKARVWGQEGEAIDCGDEAADWCSTYLKKPNCRLCYCADHLRKRRLEDDADYGNLAKPGEEVGFQDLGQYLMISEASLDNLNAKLEQPVTSRNFRPNIMVSGCATHAEDSWKFVKIGDAEFRALKPCTRCVLTTIDPETGVRMGAEPLKTLRRYRQTYGPLRKLIGDTPLFGTNLVTEKEGTIHVGDTVFASYD
ncbi:PREDICTED: mitochondrial amidoxime-reducing component 1-like [Branchiostoma belcheri]|uniref:Mitochondrial amidoxime-reducing component 1-like n=1 Tax=Branchiostoma belcheri TaxID=7741 RepID=A0A6P4Z0M3_BRABE|nr:PREDICTED: mitochondrial amidoxime-reducing component 1-like [Branchiostoma belcheri]XP_019624597.1 PREDICTED: mitochondrial amidoxime-reducing component 1-like [Branchiostoma belcheri]